MAHQHHGGARLFVKLLHLAEDGVAALRVQPGGGFVQYQQLRLHGKHARNGNAALLPARKLKRALCQHRGVQPAEFGRAQHTAVYFFLRKAHIHRAEGDILIHRLFKQLVFRVLEHKAHHKAEAADVLRLLPDVLATDIHLALRGPVDAVEMADQGAFAAPGRADDPHEAALLDGKADVVQRHGGVGHALAVDIAEMLHTDNVRHGRAPPSLSAGGTAPPRTRPRR